MWWLWWQAGILLTIWEWWKLTLPWASLHTWLLALAASGSFAQINSQIHPLSTAAGWLRNVTAADF
jgi:hypothetical protein